MTTTAKVVADFAALFEGKDEEVSLAEMKKMLTEVHKASASSSKKASKKVKKEAGEVEKPKRPPTAYNLFMKEEMEKLKIEGSTLTGKEKMQKIAELWKNAKAFTSSEEEVLPADDEKPKKSGKK